MTAQIVQIEETAVQTTVEAAVAAVAAKREAAKAEREARRAAAIAAKREAEIAAAKAAMLEAYKAGGRVASGGQLKQLAAAFKTSPLMAKEEVERMTAGGKHPLVIPAQRKLGGKKEGEEEITLPLEEFFRKADHLVLVHPGAFWPTRREISAAEEKLASRAQKPTVHVHARANGEGAQKRAAAEQKRAERRIQDQERTRKTKGPSGGGGAQHGSSKKAEPKGKGKKAA